MVQLRKFSEAGALRFGVALLESCERVGPTLAAAAALAQRLHTPARIMAHRHDGRFTTFYRSADNPEENLQRAVDS